MSSRPLDQRTRPSSKLSVIQSVTTSTEGNEPEGSFYLTYYCESSVTSDMVTVTQSGGVLKLDTSGAVVGDTIRANVPDINGDATSDWRYFTVSAVNGADLTVEVAAVDFADNDYLYAEYGDFYSGPGMEYGVSDGCLQADPDFTNNPLDHDVDAADLQAELQGLAQVNSADGCLQVSYSVFHTLVTVKDPRVVRVRRGISAHISRNLARLPQTSSCIGYERFVAILMPMLLRSYCME